MRSSKDRGLLGCLLAACLVRLTIRDRKEVWQPSFACASKHIPFGTSDARNLLGRSVAAARLFRFCFA